MMPASKAWSPIKSTLILALIFLSMTPFAIAQMIFGPLTMMGIIMAIASHVPLFLGPLLIYRIKWGLNREQLRFGKPLDAVAIGLLIGAFLGLPIGVMKYHIPPIPGLTIEKGLLMPAIFGTIAFNFLVIGPSEELVGRAFYLRALAEAMPFRNALIISSLVFGLTHLGNVLLIPNFIYVLIVAILCIAIGLILGYLYEKRGLLAAIICHANLNVSDSIIYLILITR